MPLVDLIDETFVVADPDAVAAVVADPRRWEAWWPDLRLTVFMDRGREGVRWSVAGRLVGSSEIWLEPFGDGVIVHYYLRCEPAAPRRHRLPDRPRRAARAGARLRHRRAIAWKRQVNSLKDEFEAGRLPGEPR
jgi:hypothetical protein